ncbi:penicillin-binding transpeptidase domain-containing protein [Occallatibacter riparius]|uniref:PASTA domain-containing protein n=1 Tax=Occallatibacter riparius TaxID=1002689 RepID=A0A9J7BJZ1_9BACT|nr:penicillin-binding transpeptidase domain-containing protein [Occallatibacter riparius]UWZ82098.1 PASTA domain-containing protein [Occallatibacter riparius]
MEAATLRNRNRSRTTIARAIPLRVARFWLICLFFFVWAAAISGRLFYLQILRHQEYIDRAQKQQQRTFEVAPRRGVLYDRNLHELAMTVQVDSWYADPSEIDDKDEAARRLAAIVHTDSADGQTAEDQILNRLNTGGRFAWIARRVSNETSAKVKALNLKGLYTQKEFERFYPDNEIAAQVLGYVGTDDTGLGGLEQKFEGPLHGVPGRMFTAMDARRKVLGSTEKEPEPGQNLVLTIDSNIQFLAERALDHAMERVHADNGTVVIQDVHTGQILALAIRPTFNPNQYRHTTPALLKNHAVSDVYEPGSTFKLVAYSAALDAGVAKPDDMVDCQGGSITLAGRVIHDNQGEHMGLVTVQKALEESSDVGAIKMALKVGQDRYYNYVRAFGFGQKPGVELPGETRGLLRPVNKWSGSSIGSVAMGQEIGVTPLQLVSMVSTIANGGTYLPPHVLMPAQIQTAADKSVAQQTPQPIRLNEDLPNPLPQGARRVISELAAAQMRKMMEGVVLNGTGKSAQLNGYSSGGKTGTAQKVDPATHTYSKTMHIASFAGIAPVNNPVIAVAIVMDNPKAGSYYGAAVSAPVFQEVAQQVLEYLGVPHDEPVRPGKLPKETHQPTREDDHDETGEDINALYAAVNDLPNDDALRNQTAQAVQPAAQTVSAKPAASTAAPVAQSTTTAAVAPARSSSAGQPRTITVSEVVVKQTKQVKVPSFVGMSMRQVIETAAGAGLEVQLAGSGTIREQAPSPGAMVSPGTKVVVRGSH